MWVDGGTFDVIMPLLEKELPTFQKIMREGVNGTLISTIPPCTPPAWASLACMHGRVLLDAFQPSYVKTHPVKAKEKARTLFTRERYALSEEDEQKVKKRLKALGYLG